MIEKLKIIYYIFFGYVVKIDDHTRAKFYPRRMQPIIIIQKAIPFWATIAVYQADQEQQERLLIMKIKEQLHQDKASIDEHLKRPEMVKKNWYIFKN